MNLHATLARTWGEEILRSLGAAPTHARVVAEHLVGANLAGHDSHGLIRLPQYAGEVDKGLIDVAAEPVVITDRPSMAVIDARRSWGPVAANFAVEEATRRTRSTGFAMVALRNAPHVGRVGVYPLALAREGFIAQAWCNCAGAARVAPWGGTEPKLATNPIALAFPTSDEPILIDITTSVVAEGKVRVARNAGKTLPEGWIRDRSGKPSTRPGDLYEGGTILPLGGEAFGHKGSALAIYCDLLAGVLTGGGCGLMPGTILSNGLVLWVIDPSLLEDVSCLQERTAQYLNYLRASERAEEVDEILLPGEPERRTEKRRLSEGIPIDSGTWQQLVDLSQRLGVAVPE